MIDIRICCLPTGPASECFFCSLCQEIAEAVMSLPELGLRNGRDFRCLPSFPQPGEPEGTITIEIVASVDKTTVTWGIRRQLAKTVGETVGKFFPGASISSRVETIYASEVSWASAESGDGA